MKKTIAMLLILALSAALLSVPAMAEESRTVDFDTAGVTLELPAAYLDTKGVVNAASGGELGYHTDWFYMEADYVAMEQEAYNTFMNQESYTEEELQNYRNSLGSLFVIFCVGPDTSLDELLAYLATNGGTMDMNSLSELGTADGYTFYQYLPVQDTAFFEPAFAEEFAALRALAPEIGRSAKLYAPTMPFAATVGKTLRFDTTDMDGNPVTSEALFGGHEITMLNIFTSTCHFCIEELPDLQAINGRLADKDCAIVGLLFDGDDADAVASARQSLQDAGVTYTVILAPENSEELFSEVDGFPTSFFVNRDGVVVGEPVVGKMVEIYEPAIENLLANGAAAAEIAPAVNEEKSVADKGVSSNSEGKYRIVVTDENGKPVEKATIQFCSDTQCMLGKTDAQGLAVFEVPEGIYTVHVLKVPQGYAKDGNEYTVPASYSDLSIVLKLS